MSALLICLTFFVSLDLSHHSKASVRTESVVTVASTTQRFESVYLANVSENGPEHTASKPLPRAATFNPMTFAKFKRFFLWIA